MMPAGMGVQKKGGPQGYPLPTVQDGGNPTGAPLTNTAPENPRLAGFMDSYGQRLRQLQERGTSDPGRDFQVEEYKKRLSADTTQRAIDRAQTNIRDQAAGSRRELMDEASRRGESMPWNVAARAGSDTQRAQNAATADITLGRERDKDALVLGGSRIMESPGDYAAARENELSGFTLGGLSGASTIAGQQLAQQNYGLNQWQAENQNAYQDAELQAQLAGQTAAMGKLRPRQPGRAGIGFGYAA